ncbi:MAG: YggS family pyridoxal phosphate-dependent enzyme [Bacteroidetes bacterium]|nr:YggS family pyridoxal phosphate-dependent enzyme [Bacteroidota bacterium]
MSVKENLIAIKKSLPAQVTLVAVSKTKPNELILQAYDAGQRDFGENYVQELADKYEQLPKDIQWHFIGHLQSNKVKYIVPFVHLIHGVDSFKLLKVINKQAEKINSVVNCLLQLYIAREETKFGFDFEECETVLKSEEFKSLKNICVKGFMAMASNTDDEEEVRREFSSVKQFQEKMLQHDSRLSVLSYGMSGDYQLAIECGSNMIRIGSSIFGERKYTDQ